MRVRFWGVRGSTPTPQAENLKFGGNTSCVEICTPSGECLIFDAGSGIRALGAKLLQEAGGRPDQCQHFPDSLPLGPHPGPAFFRAYIWQTRTPSPFIRGRTGRDLEEALEGQMTQPYYPIDLAQVAARRSFHEMNLMRRSGNRRRR